jgi:hypothetical protein
MIANAKCFSKRFSWMFLKEFSGSFSNNINWGLFVNYVARKI